MKVIVALIAVFTLSSCNLMSFMDKPSGDFQLLDAARACLDKGDYACARDYYQALSSSYADVKVSETTLTNLAGDNIFFMADLIKSMGTGTGGVNSFISLAETFSSRGKTTGAIRTTIQAEFKNSNSITDTTLRAYMKFITSISMMAQVLSNAVGSDGVLTADDFAVNASTCKAAATAVCAATAACEAPASTNLLNVASSEVAAYNDNGTSADDTDDTGGLYTATDWDTDASLDKLTEAVKRVDSSLSQLSGTSSGLGSALSTLTALGGGASIAARRCTRQLLIQQLFP